MSLNFPAAAFPPATVGIGIAGLGACVRGSMLAELSASRAPLRTRSATVHSLPSPPSGSNDGSLGPTTSQNVLACMRYARAWSASGADHMPLTGRDALPGEYVDVLARAEVGVWLCMPGVEWNENDNKNVSRLSTRRLRAPGGSFGCEEGRRCTRNDFPRGRVASVDAGERGSESRERFCGVEGM